MTRAAERLGMQQPPLSMQIRALETELGVRLFRRTPKGMEPSASAHMLYQRYKALAFQFDETIELVRAVARGEAGRIAIGISSSAAFSPAIPRLIRGFRSMRPDVAVNLSEDSAEDLVHELRQKTRDVVFARSYPLSTDGISVVTLMKEAMVAALPSHHELREIAANGIFLSDLKHDQFILYRRPGGPGLYDAILGACQRAGFSPVIGNEALRMSSTLNFVAAGLGVSIVPESLSRLGGEGIIYAPVLDQPALTAPLTLIYCHPNEGATGRFIAHARASFPPPAA